MVVEKRRRLLFRHIDVATWRGLEIGPFLQPTVRKDEGNVRYVDFYSAEELAQKEYERSGQRVSVPPVDFVVRTDDYYKHVPGTFDYVVANHVLEHVDNPVQWLIDLARMVRDDGVMFLAVPDKKYNFDRFRSDTPLSHLLADYFRGHGDHREHGVDIGLFYDTTYVGKPIDVREKLDLARLRRVFAEESHPGRHNHVFQSETFESRVLRPLQFLGLWPYTLLDFGDAPSNHGEFHLVLQKRPEDVDDRVGELFTVEAPVAPAAPPGNTVLTPMRRLRQGVDRVWQRLTGRSAGGSRP